MAISIPPKVIERVLLGPANDRRQLQDSPILGDVWIAFAKTPDKPCDLLIMPHRDRTAGSLAVALDERISRPKEQDGPNIAYLQDVVAARLYFEEVLRVVVPMTEWWHLPGVKNELSQYFQNTLAQDAVQPVAEKVNTAINAILEAARGREPRPGVPSPEALPSLYRYIALAGLILWAAEQPDPKPADPRTTVEELLAQALPLDDALIYRLLDQLFDKIADATGIPATPQAKRNRWSGRSPSTAK